MHQDRSLIFLLTLVLSGLIPAGLAAQGWLSQEKETLSTSAAAHDSLLAKAGTANWGEVKKISPSNASLALAFGDSVAISGDTIVGWTPGDGSAYVFERDAGGPDNWDEVKRLQPPGTFAPGTLLGAVAISGDTIVVGTPFFEVDDSAYVFERHHGGPENWGEVAKLTPSGTGVASFGEAVAISGDTIVVGAYDEMAGCPQDPSCRSGAAYVFERDEGGGWGQVKKLTATDAADQDRFAFSVTISGDTIVIGSSRADGLSGAAYIFERDEGGPDNWGEADKITPPGAAIAPHFGHSVSISGDTLVVGAFGDDACPSDPICDTGAAYVFERHQGGSNNWGEVAKLTASDREPHDHFGISVTTNGDTVVVGAAGNDDACPGDEHCSSGSAYVFERHRDGVNQWGEAIKLTASDAARDDRFGVSVAIRGDTAVVGAFGDEHGGANFAGSAYIFSGAATPPTLTLPSKVPTTTGIPVTVPVSYTGNGQIIAASTFSVDFDETCLDFDPTDGDGDGIPDAVTFLLPGDFTTSVTFAAGDTLGELDFAIADFSSPLACLSDGVLATITFTPTCNPTDVSLLAPVNFASTPTASFGDVEGQSVPGVTVDGSVEILAGIPGDCNHDGVVDAGDLTACTLEVFDGDGDIWTEVVDGTFLGSPVGCDANQDQVVDAGDLSCKILLIFDSAAVCSAPLHLFGGSGPELRLGRATSRASGTEVTLPLSFRGGDQDIVASTFSIDYDETCLAFDPSTGIEFSLPAGLTASVSFDAADLSGELDILLLDPALPFTPLREGVVAELTFTTLCDPGGTAIEAPVRFAPEPRLSFGNQAGQGVPGAGHDGGVTLTNVLFRDDFETGDTTAWSSADP